MYQNYTGSYGSGSGSMYSNYPSHSSTSTNTSTSNGNIMSKMNETSALALLQHLDKNDLQHLLENDSKLQDLIDDLPQVKSLQTEHDNLVATNKSLAEYNLSLQPKLDYLKRQVATEYETVNALKTDLAESKTKLDGFVGSQSLDTLLALLQTETAKTEEESEQLADSFCSGGQSAEEFLGEYLTKRTETHLRRIKSERFAELIRDSQGGTSSSNTVTNSWGSTSQSSSTPYPGPSMAPYPNNPNFGMPQPHLFPR